MLSAQKKQIVEAFQLLEQTNPEWLKAIVNRPTGSQWGKVLQDWTDIANLPWQPLLITDRINGLHLPQCVYYHYVKKHDIEVPGTGLHRCHIRQPPPPKPNRALHPATIGVQKSGAPTTPAPDRPQSLPNSAH